MFRNEENPEMGDLKGIPMCTLSRQEILDEAKKIKFDILETCSLGAIDPVPENLVKLFYFAIKHKEVEKGKEKEIAKVETSGKKRQAGLMKNKLGCFNVSKKSIYMYYVFHHHKQA